MQQHGLEGPLHSVVRDVTLSVDVEEVNHCGLRLLLRLKIPFVFLTVLTRFHLEIDKEMVCSLSIPTHPLYVVLPIVVQRERNELGRAFTFEVVALAAHR